MIRLAIWLANAALFALCCFLVANLLIQGAFTPEPEAVAEAPARRAAVRANVRNPQIILQRNLFNASTLGGQPVVRVEKDEPLVATKLPLRLLGTVAAGDASFSWAAVEDLEARQHRVVRVDDELSGAQVLRIERRRVVLRNGTRREELALDDQPEAKEPPRRRVTSRRDRAERRAAARRQTNNDDMAGRVRQLAKDRFAVSREDVAEVARNPATLFSQARILPKYDKGQMVGVQLNSVKAGSVFEQIGIQSGDTVVEFNGKRIESPEQSAELMRELSQAEELNLTVNGKDGTSRKLVYQFE